jgi:YesN/AraC family two-component response regulator
MAAKKDFTNINTDRVYNKIAEATEETETHEMHETQGKQKERKTYSKEEAEEFLQGRKTSGRKGLKLPRINLAFSPEVYDFVKTMSRVTGETMTEYINKVMQQHMEANQDVYKEAIKFRNMIDGR